MKKLITAILTAAFTAAVTLCSAVVSADVVDEPEIFYLAEHDPLGLFVTLIVFFFPIAAVLLLIKIFKKKK